MQDSSVSGSSRLKTLRSLQQIKDFAYSAMNNNQVTCIISIDIQNAFNSADWQLLKSKIFTLNIPTSLKQILSSFLEDRKVTLGEVVQDYNKGIPQGSCLGPILGNIFINDLLDLDLGQDSHIQAFADDILIMFKAPATFHFSSTCTVPLNKVHSWIQNNNLHINSSKSFFTIVSKKNYTHIPNIKIGNHKIKYVKDFKYLGIKIDKKLSWNQHLSYVSDKLAKIMNKLNRTTRVYWGLSPPIKKEIYRKILEKVITYGHEIWFKDQVKQNNKLSSLQRVGLLNITKCYRPLLLMHFRS
ncbi:uncharacterized protein CDAR_83511 [Caerostris darwini]|uniref:Reverse transcriptase domain-containing protein n=1 Tax=Caerostris darwini TaxID=1538125 RepID=A0AAV4NGR1_9ARAC|nr:uncharacterized protein CDAR_83511 [Caerostris darwini]